MKRNIQFLSILMAMAVLLTSMVFAVPAFAKGEEATGWDGTVATEFAGGTGKKDDPYLISSAAELAYLATFTATNSASRDKHFKVTVSEIDLKGKPWTPIGCVSNGGRFRGIFDGNGVVIKGLSLDNIDCQWVGLFGIVQNATIKNVTVYASATTLNAKSTNVGGLVGLLSADNPNTLSNCNVHVNFVVSPTAETYLGAAVGYMRAASLIENVNTFGKISVDSSAEVNVGGIVGRVNNAATANGSGDANIRSCNNYATITNKRANATTIAGGIVGATYQVSDTNKTLILTNCVNYGAVSAVTTSTARAGGIVGNMGRSSASTPDLLELHYCVNLGDITAPSGTKQLGSLIGAAEGENLTVEYCFSATETVGIGVFGRGCKVNGKSVTAATVSTALPGAYVGGITLSTLTGARVRIDTAAENNTSGLRFDSTVATAAFDALTAANFDIRLGTVIAPTSNLVAVADAYDKIAALEKASTEAAPTYIKVLANTEAWVNAQYESELGEDYDGTVNYFTGAVAKIYETNYTLAYSAVAYLTITIGDWSFTFYANDGIADGAMSKDRSRTVAYVGYMAYNDTEGNYDEGQMAVLKVYADAYTATGEN